MNGKEEEMKKKMKKLKGQGKIILAAMAVFSFVGVLSWHYMKNTQAAHDYSASSETSPKHYSDGSALINVEGPQGKESVIVNFISDDYKSSISYGTFMKKPHKYTIVGVTSKGKYKLSVKNQTITSEKNSTGTYTSLTFTVTMDIPAHEQHRTEPSGSHVSVDTPNDGISGQPIQCYTGSTGGFWEKSGHSETARKGVDIVCHMSTGNTGLCTNTGKTPAGKYTYTRYKGASITMRLEHRKGTLKFNGNKGELKETGTDTWQSSVSRELRDRQQYGTFPEARRTGYTLKEFNSDSSGGGDKIKTTWQFCGNWEVFAIWTANTYTVSYNGNGADSGNVSDGTATYDENYTFASNGYTKKGYSFVGWNSNKNATTAEYSPGTGITWKRTSNLTLYAIWSKSSYEVSFNGNGASGSKKTATLKYGANDTLPANTFERAGYTFMGWSEDPDAVKPKYTDGQTVNTLCDAGKTCELYAIWKKTDGSFDTHNIIRDDGMFNGSIELEGQNGTIFSRDHVDSEYGRLDKDGQPGYFTNRYK